MLLLHGFAESMHCWDAQARTGRSRLLAIAPSQRGYSPAARPDPTSAALSHRPADGRCDGDRRRVRIWRCALSSRGHDWGGSIAWALADRYPQRIVSLTILSRPHPNAFNRALQMPGSDQARVRGHRAFLERRRRHRSRRRREMAARAVARGRRSRRAMEKHLAILGNRAGDASRARVVSRPRRDPSPLGQIRVPTLYIWATPTTRSAGPPPKARLIRRRALSLRGVARRRPFCADQMPDASTN